PTARPGRRCPRRWGRGPPGGRGRAGHPRRRRGCGRAGGCARRAPRPGRTHLSWQMTVPIDRPSDNTYVCLMTVTTDDLVLDSLRRRMRAMHSLYADALATMGIEHVNHFEREGVLPIAFSLFHYTNMQDVSFAVISGEPVLWDADWPARVRMAT